MKKVISVLILILMIFSFSSCNLTTMVLTSLGGHHGYEEQYRYGLGDYTEYKKYYFDSVDLSKNKLFVRLDASAISDLEIYFEVFESHLKASGEEFVEDYDFDKTIIDTEDYYVLSSDEEIWGGGITTVYRLDLYIFDTQTNILYYFHTNL